MAAAEAKQAAPGRAVSINAAVRRQAGIAIRFERASADACKLGVAVIIRDAVGRPAHAAVIVVDTGIRGAVPVNGAEACGAVVLR